MITARTFLRHPWKPLAMCNSRRTFETGFIATRLALDCVVYARLESERLMGCLRRPADRKPSLLAAAYQPGRRVARSARRSRARNDLASRNARAAGIRGVACSATCGSPPNFMRARAWVKVANLKQPYRREVLENLRAVTRTRRRGNRRVRASRRDVLRHARRGLQSRWPHASDAWGNRRGPLAFRRALALRDRVRPFPGPAALDALSGSFDTTVPPISGRRSPALGRSRPRRSWPRFYSRRPETFAVRRRRAGSARAARFAAR